MPRSTPRRGAILLVVLCMLTLMALLGVSFVLYATSSRNSARLAVEAQAQRAPDADPERLLSYFLNQLLFDVPDDDRGIYSALRGHSLSRDMLGLNYQYDDAGHFRRNQDGELVDAAGVVLNNVPFHGTGRGRFDPALPFDNLPEDSPAKDDQNLVNFTYFAQDGFLRDPERKGWRVNPPGPGRPDNRKDYVGGVNSSYTYPDLNHPFLAAVRADGRVMLPSFHRPWAGFGPLGPSNWRWTSNVDPTLSPDHPLYNLAQPWVKYHVLRPRPIDMGPGFPLPDDDGGDVKNLIGTPGGNDSIWLDLDFPVMRAADGRKFKPLFAPLIVDLDGRVNLNVHGNLRGIDNAQHGSNHGLGPWEVNPARLVLLPDVNSPDYATALARQREWSQLLFGVKPAGAGRYGWDNAPHSAIPGNLATAPLPRFYAPLDFDGSRELATGTPSVVGRPTAKLRLPGARRTLAWTCFPTTPPRAGYGNGSDAERRNHSSLHNPFRPHWPDRNFALSDLESLYRQGDTGGQSIASPLLRLCPRNFFDLTDPAGSARRRRMVTLASFDPDRPGVVPWFWSKSDSDGVYNRLPPRERSPNQSPHHPAGDAVPTWDPNADFETEIAPDGRASSALTAIRRIDLNRYLPAYPNPDDRKGRITDLTGFNVAQLARQHFATELFELLWRTTGTGDPTLVPPPSVQHHDATRWDALRWLAQLAVNVVDFIDADDVLTPFCWFTDLKTGRQEWVFGTELPRVVLNEVYAEYVNVPDDAGLSATPPRATRLKGNVWIELYNPFRDDPPLTAPYRKGEARLEIPATDTEPAYGAYRVILARLTNDLRQPGNVRGEISPTTGYALTTLSRFSPEANANPAPIVDTTRLLGVDSANNQGYSGGLSNNKGFYLLGPTMARGETSPFAEPIETLARSELSYTVPANFPRLLLDPSVLLQRLACPALPPQPDPAQPNYNPYVTVDYVRDVPANYAAEVGIEGNGQPAPLPAVERYSHGRKQPYAAHVSQLARQEPNPPRDDQPQHSFFQHNVDSTTPGPNTPTPPSDYPPFEWLMHLDRPLVSVMELLHVSAFKPHELTQQFRTGDTDRDKYAHRAPWCDEDLGGASTLQSHRLYRALEFLTTGSRLPGMMSATTTSDRGVLAQPGTRVTPKAMWGVTESGGTWRIEVGSTLVLDRGTANEEVVRVHAVGPVSKPTWFEVDVRKRHDPGFTIAPVTISERLPGKVNLNTVWDEEIFLALCDPNSANTFTQDAARNAFKLLVQSRTAAGDVPGPSDRPLLGMASGAGGLQDTLLRYPDPGATTRLPLLAVPGSHPTQTFEMLTKIYNNTTVRSNVFAVWLTVGFFAVTDESVRPVKLGAEIGRSEDRQVRRRMFAIVDRSGLVSNPGPQTRFDPRAPLPGFATAPVIPYFSLID